MFARMFPVLAAVAILGACQTTSSVQTSPATTQLVPLDGRRAVVGDQVVMLDQSGKQDTNVVLSVDDAHITGETSTGCAWKQKLNSFAPDVEWKNCSNSGSQTSQRLGGSIFPLQVGSKEEWDYSGTNNEGGSWSGTRRCEAIGMVSVTVPAGTFDTYHVKCEDRVWLREWFLRADGISVQFARIRKAGAQDRNILRKLVSFTPAQG